MAEFLTTQGILHEIENIIINAKNKVVLISPYVKLPPTLFERLKDTDNRSVKITLVYGKDELNPAERSKLGQLNNLSLYFRENLHAKCFFNEERLVIASMNMYEHSANNREMGVSLSLKDDQNAFSKAVKEAESIVIGAKEISSGSSRVYSAAAKADSRTTTRTRRTRQGGFCLRCRTPIPRDLEHPYCYACFSEWNFFGNPEYEECFCHTCGKPEPTTIEKPLCSSCYWEKG